MPQPDLNEFVRFAAGQRRVKTEEGAKLFNKPVGTLIGTADEPDKKGLPTPKGIGDKDASVAAPDPPKREVTLERMKSLKAALDAANETGSASTARVAKEAFQKALSEFAKGRDPQTVKQLLS